jgi:hypothetical protein
MTRSAIWKLQPTTLLLCGLAAAVGCTSDKAEDVALASTREPPTKGVNRVCGLVTRSEMESILGSPVEPPHDGDDADKTTCVYAVPGGISAAEISVDWEGGPAAWKGVSLGKQLMDKTATGMGLGQFNEPVAGLGDEAFVQGVKLPKLDVPGSAPLELGALASGHGVLWVKKGDAVMSITVANEEDAKEKATAIARKALSRM